MFFLLRCAFWLGLTFSMMDWPGGLPVMPEVSSLTQSAANHLASGCASALHACLEGMQKLESLSSGRETKSAIQEVETAAAPLPPRRPGANSLKGSDLQPAWRGRG